MRFELIIAFRNLWRNTRQTSLNLLLIGLTCFICIFLQSQRVGTQVHILETIVEPMVGYLQIQSLDNQANEKNRDFQFSQDLKKILTQFPNIKSLNPRLEKFGLVQKNQRTKNVLMIGVEPDLEQNFIIPKIIQGKYWSKTDSNGVLLPEGFAKSLKVNVDDSIRFLSDKTFQTFKIRGIIALSNPSQNKSLVFIPLTSLQKIWQKKDSITRLILKIESPAQAKTLFSKIKSKLPPTLDIQNWENLMPELAQLIQVEEIAENLVLAVLYILLIFMLLSSMLMMTYTREAEFATLLSLGMKRIQLIKTIILEIFILGVLGVLLGVLGVFPVLWHLHLHPIIMVGDIAQSLQNIGLSPTLAYALDWEVFFYPILSILGMIFLTFIYPIYFIQHLKFAEKIR